MMSRDEIPGSVSSAAFLFNSALRQAQRAGFEVEITERQATYGARPMLTLDVVVHEKGQAHGSHTVSGVYSGLSG
jgi:hypothetical protein